MAKKDDATVTKKMSAEDALASARAILGDRAVRFLDEKPAVEVISTGSLTLDMALGVGGIPRGRIIEVYGPASAGKTTFCLMTIAELQKKDPGAVIAYIDMEGTLDQPWANFHGVDTSRMIIAQPDDGEDAMTALENWIRGQADLVVVDSVAALVPRKELEAETGSATMGQQARLMSQAMRKITSALNSSGGFTTIIFTNQIRMKIGVMYGCFHYSARVVLADGTTEKIGKIVNGRLPVQVQSYNPATGEIESRPVVDWHNNGPADSFLQFEVKSVGGSGKWKFACTPAHIVLTPNGEQPADNIQVGDTVLAAAPSVVLSEDQEALVVGSALGDGATRNGSVRFGHSLSQEEYLRWKYAGMGTLSDKLREASHGVFFETTPLNNPVVESAPWGKKSIRAALTDQFLSRINLKAVAVWYMDDANFSGSFSRWGNGKATISCKSFTENDLHRLANRLVEIGLPRPTLAARKRLMWSGDACGALQTALARYIVPSMQYKLHPDLRGNFDWPFNSIHSQTIRTAPAVVLRRYLKPVTRGMNRFDLTVECNHTYLVDHVVVHNSPETTTGGESLKFYASVRLDMRRSGKIQKGDEIIGDEITVKVVKNKVAPARREATYAFISGKGIDHVAEVFDVGLKLGVIEKSGNTFSFQGEKIAVGKPKTVEALHQLPDLAAQIEAKVREKVAAGEQVVQTPPEDEEDKDL